MTAKLDELDALAVADKLIREADELDDYVSALAGRIRTAEDDGGFENHALVYELEAETTIVREREADLRKAAALLRAQAEEIARLTQRLKSDDRRIAVLVQCALAINSLPADALGYGESGGAEWPLRDELLDAIILAMPDPAKARAALGSPPDA